MITSLFSQILLKTYLIVINLVECNNGISIMIIVV